MAKTIGDLLVEVSKSGDPKAIQAAMKMFWGEARKLGLPTPDTHPPAYTRSVEGEFDNEPSSTSDKV